MELEGNTCLKRVNFKAMQHCSKSLHLEQGNGSGRSLQRGLLVEKKAHR